MNTKIFSKWWFWVIAVIVFLMVVSYFFGEDDIANAETTTSSESTIKQAEETTTQELTIGSSKDNPYVLTVAELVEEIEADIDAAKDKYNGKWVKITGEITDTTSGGGIYGYYLYGKRITTGYSGLQIICWCDNGPYSGSVLGDTQTFLGQVREITTFNATEIGDCERIK